MGGGGRRAQSCTHGRLLEGRKQCIFEFNITLASMHHQHLNTVVVFQYALIIKLTDFTIEYGVSRTWWSEVH
jgi:hypothetical protein